MQRDIALLTLSAALGLMGLSTGAAPIDPFPTIGTGAELVVQSHAKESEKPWYDCKTREAWNGSKQTWCQKLEVLKNAKYQIPGVGLVQLKNGTYTNPAQKLRVVLVNKPEAIAFGDLNKDGKEDATVLLGVNSEGFGTVSYLSVVVNQADSFNNSASILLGDQVKVQAIAIDAAQIKVNLVKHGTRDPRCCPTQPTTQLYSLQGSKLAPLVKPAITIKQPQSWLDLAKTFDS